MIIDPVLDLLTLVLIALVISGALWFTPLSRDVNWYAYRLGTSSRIGLAAWCVSVVGIYGAGQLTRTNLSVSDPQTNQ